MPRNGRAGSWSPDGPDAAAGCGRAWPTAPHGPSARGAEPAPAPVATVRAEADANRVRPNVVADSREVGLVLDRLRLEPALKEVSGASVAVVEGGCVEAVQPFHPIGERGLPALDHEVEVVAHQAVGMAAPTKPLDRADEERHEQQPVVVVHEDRAPVDAARGDVPEAVPEGRAQRSCHAPTVRDRASLDQWPQTTRLPWPRPGPAPSRV